MNNKNLLPGVPAVESPFFDQIFTTDGFTENEIRIARDLRDRGYAVFDFPDEDLRNKADAIKAALHSRYPWEAWQTGDADMRIQDAWTFDANVHSLATNSQIQGLLSKLYGRRAWPFQTLNFAVGSQQHFHTDSLHFSSVPERFMCGVWIALEDIEDDQGPLEYYPGSHKWPIYTNEHIGVIPSTANTQATYHDLWEALLKSSNLQREVFRAKKAQALIWTANLLHGGMPHLNKSKTRWSQVTHYYFDDCAYYTPMLSDPFRGLIQFRNLLDLTTMTPVANAFSGAPIPRSFVETAPGGFERFDAKRARRAKKLSYRLRRAFGLMSPNTSAPKRL